jgi:hypothetical protein
LENWKAAVPISSPIASVDKCFMKVSSLFVLIGRDVSIATRDVNEFFMLHLRCAWSRLPRMLTRSLLGRNENG